MMHRYNPYVEIYKQAFQKIQKDQDLCVIIKNDPSVDRRRYNAPSAPDIAAILPEDPVSPRDIVISYRENNGLKRINELSSSYDPLHYVLMHPQGQQGFELQIKRKNSETKYITAMQFYAYRLMIRNNYHVQVYGRLFKQYVVDMYIKIEHSRLKFLKHMKKNCL